jgi:nucleoid DNA-binding protein
MDWYSNNGRSGLIRELVDKGYSLRKAAKLVNAVFDTMTDALKRGEQVEIPGGSIQVEDREGKARLELNHVFQDLETGEPVTRPVRYKGKRKIVKFVSDESLDLSPLPAAPRPARRETPEFAACRKLASELVEEPIDNIGMQLLQRVVYSHARSPTALLAALRERKARGYGYETLELLAADIGSAFRPGPGQGFSAPKDLEPQPPNPEQIESLKLAAELLGWPVSPVYINTLQQAADFPVHKAGSLLRRLRMIRDKGWKCSSLANLATAIRQHFGCELVVNLMGGRPPRSRLRAGG